MLRRAAALTVAALLLALPVTASAAAAPSGTTGRVDFDLVLDRPNDPAALQWWWPGALLRLPRAWDASTGAGARIALLSTDVDATATTWGGALLPPVDLVDGRPSTGYRTDEGTHLASLLVDPPDRAGTRGVAYGARLLPVVVQGEVPARVTPALLTTGLQRATAAGVDVVVVPGTVTAPDPALRRAVENAVSGGAVVVAAAGDTGQDTPLYPAAWADDIDGLLAVSSTAPDGRLSGTSSWGDWVSLAAPGEDVTALSAGWASDGLLERDGSGAAAAFVGGTAALLAARGVQDPAQLEALLTGSARDAGPRGHDPYFGSGILDAAGALARAGALDPAPAVPADATPADPGPEDGVPALAQALPDGLRTLAPEGDVDWYRYTAPTAGAYRVDVVPQDVDPGRTTRSLDPVLEVRDGQGRVQGRSDLRVAGRPERVWAYARAGEELLVGVSGRNGAAPGEDETVYGLTVTGPVRDPYRPVTTSVVDDPTVAHPLAVGELTGDGLADTVASLWDGRLAVLGGTVSRAVGAAPAAAWPVDEVTTAAAVDVTGDGRADVVARTSTGDVLLLRGTATTPRAPATVTTRVRQVTVADADGDGDLDLVLQSDRDLQVQVWANDGSGTFAAAGTRAQVGTDLVQAVGDTDGDRLPDLVLPDRVVPRLAGGGWGTPRPLPATGGPYPAHAFADLDGDGRAEWVRLRADLRTLEVLRPGSTTTAVVTAPTQVDRVTRAAARTPGRDAVVLTSSSWPGGDPTVLLLEQPPGAAVALRPATQEPLELQPGDPVGQADVDADGGLDVVLGGGSQVLLADTGIRQSLPSWVQSTSPQPGATGVQGGESVLVATGTAIDAASVDATSVRLVDLVGGDVPVTRRVQRAAAGDTVVLDPVAPLEDGRSYEVVVDGLRTGGVSQPGTYRAWFTVGADGDRFTPMPPQRVLDTRTTLPDRVPPGRRVPIPELTLWVPADATAVVLNVTAVDPSGAGNVRAFPLDPGHPQDVPQVSHLNVVRGVDQAGAVTVPLGPTGEAVLMTDGASAHLVADLAGYYSPGGALGAVAVEPARVLDTRTGTGGVPVGPVRAGHWVDVRVAGRGGVPADAAAVTLNVTATQVTGRTHVRVLPTPADTESQFLPEVSSLNLDPGRDQANQVTVRVGDGGRIRLYTHSADLHLVADLTAWYSPTGDLGFVPVAPTRIADTRTGLGLPAALQPGTSVALTVAGRAGVPADAAAAVLTVTAAAPRGTTHVRTYPWATTGVPTVSTLNLVAGRDEANATLARLGAGGAIGLYTHSAATDLVVDVSGFLTR